MAMSIFAVGGNAGFAFGPLQATGAMLAWGLKGTLIFALSPVIVAAFLYFQFRDMALPQPQKRAGGKVTGEALEDQWFPFLRLTGVVVVRSVLFFGLTPLSRFTGSMCCISPPSPAVQR
jgi:MFS transporter, FSR family, fosmidomycin resistance protein